ncbi:MAG: tRNA dihydrouridine synthase DusB [Bacillota bacterium]
MLLKIGPINVSPGLALAPMAGISDHPFRILARQQGCPLVYSEMISARGLYYNPGRQRYLLHFTEEERPIGFQLFGSEPQVMAEAARKLEEVGPDCIDLNLGCPTPKVIRNGDGGALMRDPELAWEIFKAVAGAVKCPVTVKMRKGWDEQAATVLEIAARAEEAGLQAITVHGRTVKQGYSGLADWGIIRQVKETVAIPVIGNGDVDSADAAEAMFSYCNCDGIMIGRAARGNPWIFKAVRARLEGESAPKKPSRAEVTEMACQHLNLLINLKGETAAVREMRTHASWYIKSFPGAAMARKKLVQAKTKMEMVNILREYSLYLRSAEQEDNK